MTFTPYRADSAFNVFNVSFNVLWSRNILPLHHRLANQTSFITIYLQQILVSFKRTVKYSTRIIDTTDKKKLKRYTKPKLDLSRG